MNKIIISGMIILLICTVLSGCNTESNQEMNHFVGTWKQQIGTISYVFNFFSDGTCSILTGFSGTYAIKNRKLIIDIYYEPITFTYDYSFSNNYETLTLNDLTYSGIYTLTKQ